MKSWWLTPGICRVNYFTTWAVDMACYDHVGFFFYRLIWRSAIHVGRHIYFFKLMLWPRHCFSFQKDPSVLVKELRLAPSSKRITWNVVATMMNANMSLSSWNPPPFPLVVSTTHTLDSSSAATMKRLASRIEASDETASYIYIPLAVLLAAVVSFHQDLRIVPQFLVLPKANYKTDSAFVVAKMVAMMSGYILVLCLLYFDHSLISLCVQKASRC